MRAIRTSISGHRKDTPRRSISEYGWEFALAFVSSLLFFDPRGQGIIPRLLETTGSSFQSAGDGCCCELGVLLAFVVITWWLSRYLGILTASNVGGYVLAFFVIWSLRQRLFDSHQ